MNIFYSILKLKAVLLLTAVLLPVVLSAQPRELSVPTTGDFSSNQSIRLLPGFSTSGPFRAYIISGLNEKLNSSPSPGQNYVRTQTYKEATTIPLADPSVNQVSEVIQYVDGLGRPVQTIQTKASPQGYDIIQPVAYDQFGRESVKYLPYAEQNGGGIYRTDALSRQLSFYSSSGWDGNAVKTVSPYSQTIFEASPLNRVAEQGAPGSVWQPASQRSNSAGRTVVLENGSNAAASVVLWKADAAGTADFHLSLSVAGYYEAGQLYLKTIKDENWVPADGRSGTTEEYTDKDGHVVLKRVFNGIEILSTYYVYDDFGNLGFVLPPGSNPDGASMSNMLLEQFCYQYAYDGRHRLVGKRLPGTGGWTEMVYNVLDQVVFSQDPLERAAQRRSFIKYDALGRVVMSGQEKNSSLDRNSLQNIVNSWPEQWETRDNSNAFYGYSNGSVPSNVSQLETEVVNYYDNYDIPNLPDNTSGNYSNKTRGLLTASLTRVLGTGDFLWTVNYYDEEGRIASQYRQHYLKGTVNGDNYDRIANTYNFEGALTASSRQHYSNAEGLTTIANRYIYDHVGRRLQSYEKINANDEVLLIEDRYNELGQLKEKALHNGQQQTAYTYNERGWLKGSHSPQFSQDLYYQDGGVPQFNGNISAQYWGTGTNLSNNFAYTYDKLNRLTSGQATGMSEVISYDVMGNIKSLNRDGIARTYSYLGNQLQQVTGMSSYLYDANGNATTDGRSGNIITYNRLNLPSGVAALNLSYVYDAAGNKLKKKSGAKVTDYISGIQYTDGALELIQTEAGVARKNGSVYSYEYNLSDHLGNVRYTFYKNPVGGSIERLQSDDYYPFGLRKLVQEGTNKYLYNGKELQQELGQYDYGARFYDPVIGRWNVPDMLAELATNLTPFRYCFNNPVNYTDPFGLWERTANGYTTGKKEDIERFFDMMQIENHSLKNNPNMSQMSGFIDGEMKTGGLGTLSYGSKLAKGFTINQQRDFYGGKHWVTDQKSYNNFSHSVQGDLTPEKLDTRTLGKNLMWTSYAGPDNPKKYNGDDDFSYNPRNATEQAAIKHDLAYKNLNISGLNGLLNDKRAIKADYTYVAENYGVALNPNNNILVMVRAYLLGQGLGLMALPKTIENYMPTMVNPPSK